MTFVVHVGKLCPRIVYRIVAEQTVRGVRAITGRNATGNVTHFIVGCYTCETHRTVAGHRGAETPISGRRIVHLDNPGRRLRRRRKRMMVAHDVDLLAQHSTFDVLLGLLQTLG